MSDRDFLLELAGIFARHSIREMNRAEELELSASRARADADRFNTLAANLVKRAVYGEKETSCEKSCAANAKV